MGIQPARSPNGPDWIAVFITHNLPEAHIIMGKLRANDLPAMIHQEAGATALGLTLGNLGEIKILVAPADYDRAASILYPEDLEQLEAKTDKLQIIWQDDDNGDQYYVEDEDDE